MAAGPAVEVRTVDQPIGRLAEYRNHQQNQAETDQANLTIGKTPQMGTGKTQNAATGQRRPLHKQGDHRQVIPTPLNRDIHGGQGQHDGTQLGDNNHHKHHSHAAKIG